MAAVEIMGGGVLPGLGLSSRHPKNAAEIPTGTIHDTMLASIGRTMLLGSVRIPLIPFETLEKGNQRVRDEYGDTARELTIIGPDVVSFDNQPTVHIHNRHVGDLLGYMLMRRVLAPMTDLFKQGFLSEIVEPAKRTAAASYARKALLDTVLDSCGLSVLTHLGNEGRGGVHKNGMPDVVVTDIRHTISYQRERQRLAVPFFEDFILADGPRPAMNEQGFVLAARTVMRSVASDELYANPDQRSRFQIISQQVAAMTEYRTDARSAEIDDEMGYRERRALRQEFVELIEPTWQERGSCRGPQRELFFPPGHFEVKREKQERERRAKEICATCPVQQECLRNALEIRESFGIWGGRTEDERRGLKVQPSLN